MIKTQQSLISGSVKENFKRGTQLPQVHFYLNNKIEGVAPGHQLKWEQKNHLTINHDGFYLPHDVSL